MKNFNRNEFMEGNINKTDKYECYIVSDGTTTDCVCKLNDKIINKSRAELSPIDKFDFKEGCKICIDRVFKAKKDDELNEGDIVQVINSNQCYSTYDEWILKNIDDKKILLDWKNNTYPSDIKNKKFEIVKKGNHLNSNKMVYCIKLLDDYGDEIFLFDRKGLKRVEQNEI